MVLILSLVAPELSSYFPQLFVIILLRSILFREQIRPQASQAHGSQSPNVRLQAGFSFDPTGFYMRSSHQVTTRNLKLRSRESSETP